MQRGLTQTNASLVISSINIPLSIAVLLGNTVILIALQKETSLHPLSKLLLLNLVITDLCIGLIAQPLYILYLMSIAYEHWKICRLAEMFSFICTYILCGVSLWTVIAASVDRMLALLMRTRYRQVVTWTRIRILLLVLWVQSVCSSFTFVWNVHAYSVISAISILVCLNISTSCYTKIVFILRRHQAKIRGNPN